MITGTAIAEANAEELRRARTFEHWRDTINMHSLRSDFWVMALAAVARQESDIAAQRANATIRSNYQDYLNGGPALGLGRQHRMSRTAVAWTSTKVGTSKLLIIDDLDDVDGLSADDMAAVLRHECSIRSPLDAQQEAEDQADKWSDIWAVGTDDNGTIASLFTCGD